jgi:competence protein ComEC
MNNTRFRAYQLGNEGSSFSYCHNGRFTLLEARLTDRNKSNVLYEINTFGGGDLATLHITSWDKDHCHPIELDWILKELKPSYIQAPGYEPHSNSGEESKKTIEKYASKHGRRVTFYSPDYLNSLSPGSTNEKVDIVYWPYELSNEPNNNSIAKLFRCGDFSVLSLGDLQSASIADKISRGSIIKNEVD